MDKNDEFKLLLIPFIIILLVIFLPLFSINLLFAGVVFLLFINSIELKQYYLVFFLIISNIFIEANNSFDIFSLTIIDILIFWLFYKKVIFFINLTILQNIIFLTLFYISLFLYLLFIKGYDIYIYKSILLNFIIDFIIGFII